MKSKIKKRKKEKEETKIKKDHCPECGSFNVKYNQKNDEIICQDCGAIFVRLTPEEEKRFEEALEQ